MQVGRDRQPVIRASSCQGERCGQYETSNEGPLGRIVHILRCLRRDSTIFFFKKVEKVIKKRSKTKKKNERTYNLIFLHL